MVQRRERQIGSFGESHVPCVIAGDDMAKFPDTLCERFERKELDLKLAQRLGSDVGLRGGNLLRTLESTNYAHRFNFCQLRSA